MFERRNIICPGCDVLVEGVEETFEDWFPLNGGTDGGYYESQNYTCRNCLKHSCYACKDENGRHLLRYCNHCKMDYCGQCEPVAKCDLCDHQFCRECRLVEKCGNCEDHHCSECESMRECRGYLGVRCDVKLCESCAEEKEGSCDACKWQETAAAISNMNAGSILQSLFFHE